MKKIPLTQGKFALVDDEDYEYLNQFKWCYNSGYAVRNLPRTINKKRTVQRMHRVVVELRKFINIPDNLEVDHKDHNRLNNKKDNLRLCTRYQNLQNGLKHSNTTSKYKGVSWHKRDKKWYIYITVKGIRINLGTCSSEKNAARFYNEMAKKYFGEFASLNIIDEE